MLSNRVVDLVGTGVLLAGLFWGFAAGLKLIYNALVGRSHA
jgi:hypothetical protein